MAWLLAPRAGLEPATYGLTVHCLYEFLPEKVQQLQHILALRLHAYSLIWDITGHNGTEDSDVNSDVWRQSVVGDYWPSGPSRYALQRRHSGNWGHIPLFVKRLM